MEKRKRFGDRWDGKRIRGLDGIHSIMPYLFKNRVASEVYSKEAFDMTEVLEQMKGIKEEDPESGITAFHYIVTAFAKTIYHRPDLNRFIAGKRFYQRNFITFSFIVKRYMGDEAKEIIMILKIDETMNLLDISKKITGEVTDLREAGKDDVDLLLQALRKLPRFLMTFVMFIFRTLDFYGKMPRSVCHGDINYQSLLLSNLGSINADACYHHLNDYGTNSMVCTIGRIHKEKVLDPEGKESIRDVANFGITIDERIADGFYFARSTRLLKHLLLNPDILLSPIKEAIDYEY